MTNKERDFISGLINTYKICIEEDERTLNKIESLKKGVLYNQNKTLLATRIKEDKAIVTTLNNFLKLVDDDVLK